MGIKGLSKILKDRKLEKRFKRPDVKIDRIAVDISILIHAKYYTARKAAIGRVDPLFKDPTEEDVLNELYSLILHFANDMMKDGILPIFVFDGEHCEEKKLTQKSRVDSREKMKQKYDDIREKLLEIRKGLQDGTLAMDCSVFCRVEEYKKAYCSNSALPKDTKSLCEEFLRTISLPVLKARGEAENLCTALCREGYVDGVYSTDTDNLAMGCPLMFKQLSHEPYSKDDKFYSLVFIGYDMNDILESFDMSLEEFKDFCILLSCDFNKNIPKMGPVGCQKMAASILSGKRGGVWLEKVPKDTSCLNYERCREIFDTTLREDERLVFGQSIKYSPNVFRMVTAITNLPSGKLIVDEYLRHVATVKR